MWSIKVIILFPVCCFIAVIFWFVTVSVQNKFWYFFRFSSLTFFFGGSLDLVEAKDVNYWLMRRFYFFLPQCAHIFCTICDEECELSCE
jgi:hypothetical protein